MLKNYIAELEKRLWDVADELRANSDLKSSEYSPPVLGLIFLKYADYRFTKQEKILSDLSTKASVKPGKPSIRRRIGKTDYQAAGVMYLPDEARFSYLLNLPEGADIGRAINEAMKSIEHENEDLKSVLPRTYNRFKNNLLVELIKLMSSIPKDIEGKYQDIAGLCKVAALKEIEEQGWSLNPGRYVGVVNDADDRFDFKERFEELNEELEVLNTEAKELEEQISENVTKILEAK